MTINDQNATAPDAREDRKTRAEQEIARAGIALSADETVNRFGSANAEFIIGYRGVDNETGKEFAKGLADIAKHRVHPDPIKRAQNIKQQAGYSAEVSATSRRNAEAHIQRSDIRVSRSDDLPEYGRNHTVVDLVELRNGQIIEGSQAQMKFVGSREKLFESIARDEGEFKRYRGVKLELPSEQFEGPQALRQQSQALRKQAQQASEQAKSASQRGDPGIAREYEKAAAKHQQEAAKLDRQAMGAREFCQDQAAARRADAQRAEQAGRPEDAAKLRREAANYDQLADNVKDSGMTSEYAVFCRENPKLATAMEIARTSHRAGMEGAKFGAIIGGCITLLKNSLALAQDEKTAKEALVDMATDTAKAGAMGYATALAGAAIKGGMQQSGNQALRTLANTSAPTLALNVCLSLGQSVKRYVTGEISEAELLTEVGEKGAGMLSSGMMAALGQLAIPIPFVGAAIGGMIGYSLSTLFYQSALDAATAAETSRVNLERVRAIQAAARASIAEQQESVDAFLRQEMPQLRQQALRLLAVVDTPNPADINAFSAAIDEYASLLGKQLQLRSMAEFDDFMASDQPLKL